MASDCEEICAAVIFGFGIPRLSVGLTSDGTDLACCLLTKPQLSMIQELSQRVLCGGHSLVTVSEMQSIFHFVDVCTGKKTVVSTLGKDSVVELKHNDCANQLAINALSFSK